MIPFTKKKTKQPKCNHRYKGSHEKGWLCEHCGWYAKEVAFSETAEGQDCEDNLRLAEMELQQTCAAIDTDFDKLIQALKSIRKNSGWTLIQCAKMAGVSPTQLSKWTAEPFDTPPDIICKGGKQ